MEYITYTWYCDTAIKFKLLKKCWHDKEHLKIQRPTSWLPLHIPVCDKFMLNTVPYEKKYHTVWGLRKANYVTYKYMYITYELNQCDFIQIVEMSISSCTNYNKSLIV